VDVRLGVAWCFGFVVTLALAGCDESPSRVDAGGGADAGVDAGPPVVCAFPDPVVAGTAETDAVADAPARCGQSPHVWLRDASLGTVVEIGSTARYSVAVLTALVEGAGVTLSRDPTDSVELREFRYLTQDRGVMVETTATVAYPDSRTPGEMLDMVLFLHGTSGFAPGCGPSEDETGLLAALFASYGYVVVMPDFLGLEWGEASYGEPHPYLVGQPTAIASIDAVRAAARLPMTDRGRTCVAPRVITFGASQGGHAALWVDRLMPYYARELQHLGVAATTPPTDLVTEAERGLSMLTNSSGNFAAMLGTAPFWYGVGGRLDELFVSPLDVQLPEALAASCSPDGLDGTTMISDVFVPAIVDAATMGTLGSVDPWGCVLAENGLTTTSIPRLGGEPESYGILHVLAEEDDLVTTPIQREAYRSLCTEGAPLAYLECAGAGHGEGTFWSLPEVLDFIDARAAGTAFVPSSCEPAAATTCAGTPAP